MFRPVSHNLQLNTAQGTTVSTKGRFRERGGGEATWIIRDFPDHATFREKGAKLACADKLGVFLSLTLCDKANFDSLERVKYDSLEKM